MKTDPYADFPARAAAVQRWLLENLISEYQLNFSALGARRNLFSVVFDGCLYNLLLDGHCSAAGWTVDDHGRRSDRLFAAMGELALTHETSKVLLQFHDDAYFGHPVVVPTLPDQFHRAMLYMLQWRPADEAGTTYLGLLHEDFRGMVLFTDGIRNDHPTSHGRRFDVDFYGTEDRYQEFLLAMETETKAEPGRQATASPSPAP